MRRSGIKALFFDIDGTLLSFRSKSMPESARRALLAAHDRGVLLFAATGRHMLSVRSIAHLQGIPFSGYVTMNGQYCLCGDEIVHHAPLHREDVARIVRYARDNPLTLLFQSADEMVANREDKLLETFPAAGMPTPRVCEPAWPLERELYQICVYTPDEHTPPVLEEMRHSAYTRWHRKGLDIIPREGGKRVGVARMLARFGIRPQEAAAFGDGENDIGMFESVGVAVAMGNAPASVKAAADLVTDDVDDDGIHNALQRLLEPIQSSESIRHPACGGSKK